MKILMVTNLYPPAVLGGYEILCEQVAGEFAGRGHEIVVLTSDFQADDGSPAADEFGRHGERLSRLMRIHLPFDHPPKRARIRHLLADRHNRRVTHRLIERERPDIVFFWSLRRLSLGPVRAAADSGEPYALTLNDDYLLAYKPSPPSLKPGKSASFLLDRTLFRRTTYSGLRFPAITAISRSLVDNMVRRGAPVAHAAIIHQGVDIRKFSPKEHPGSIGTPARLLYVGQLHDYKGVHTAIESLSALAGQGRELLLDIVGSGDPAYEERLKQLAERLDVAGQVAFLGKISHDRLPEVYRSHDIFVFPSTWDEPFGLTHLEAMACGTPVVSTTKGGPGEFLRDGENALTFEAKDARDLTDKLADLLDDDGLRAAIAKAGRSCVVDLFSADRYVSDLERFLQDTIDRWPQL